MPALARRVQSVLPTPIFPLSDQYKQLPFLRERFCADVSHTDPRPNQPIENANYLRRRNRKNHSVQQFASL